MFRKRFVQGIPPPLKISSFCQSLSALLCPGSQRILSREFQSSRLPSVRTRSVNPSSAADLIICFCLNPWSIDPSSLSQYTLSFIYFFVHPSVVVASVCRSVRPFISLSGTLCPSVRLHGTACPFVSLSGILCQSIRRHCMQCFVGPSIRLSLGPGNPSLVRLGAENVV